MDDELSARCRSLIRTIPDFPRPDIQYRDITPLLGDGGCFRAVIDHFAERLRVRGEIPKAVVCPEARGFILGAALAYRLGIGFVPVRKADKLPHETRRVDYDLEYGSDSVEMHIDALSSGDRVVVVDDLLATGGTMAACHRLLAEHGVVVDEALFLIELEDLGGRARLAPVPVHALIGYTG